MTAKAPLLKSVVFPRADTAVLVGAVQPRAVSADAPGVPAGDAPGYGVRPRADAAVSGVSALQVLFIDRCRCRSRPPDGFRDVKHLIEIGHRHRVLDDADHLRAHHGAREFRQLALLWPMAPFIRAYQDIFYYGVMPDPDLARRACLRRRRFICGFGCSSPTRIAFVGLSDMDALIDRRAGLEALRHPSQSRPRLRHACSALFHRATGRRVEDFWALRDVDSHASTGESLGLIGPERLGQEHAAQAHRRHPSADPGGCWSRRDVRSAR